jgi:hypothetical protein
LNLTWLVLMLAALVQLAGAGMMDQMLVRDSLRDIEPWLRPRWLAARGLSDYYAAHSWKPAADSGLACVGRWSYGPSVKVSLRVTADDTVVCLARGSGASVIRFRSQDSLTLALLSDINCSGITSRAIIKDTLVFCGMQQGGTGIEVWGISNLTSPHRLSYVYLPPIMDIAVQDTFLYAIGYQQDSLRIFNVADPHNPVQVGACADSGINGMYVAGEYCYLADQYASTWWMSATRTTRNVSGPSAGSKLWRLPSAIPSALSALTRVSSPCGCTTLETRPRPSRLARWPVSKRTTSTCRRRVTRCSTPPSCTSSTSPTRRVRGR